MNHIKKFIFGASIVLFFLFGLSLIFNKQIEGLIVKNQTESYRLKNVNTDELKENSQKQVDFDFKKINTMNPESVLKAKLSKKKLPVIGGVAIPDVSLNLPIFKGISNEALLWGAGTMTQTQQMGEGNYALASHRAYEPDLLFSPLEKVNIGEKVYLTDLVKVYEYTINFKEKVAPTKTELLNVQPGKKIVTLVTCGDMNATTRLVVQGNLTGKFSIRETSKNILGAFNIESKTY